MFNETSWAATIFRHGVFLSFSLTRMRKSFTQKLIQQWNAKNCCCCYWTAKNACNLKVYQGWCNEFFGNLFQVHFLLSTSTVLVKRGERRRVVLCSLVEKLWLHQATFSLSLCNLIFFIQNCDTARCLKIKEKVAFNNASEASYVHILSGPKMVHFSEFVKT